MENKSYPGLFDCVLEHKVTETSSNFQWSGPRMTPEMWAEIMAFFQWTYKEHKSEAQVRLFVHPDKGWMAWAFPQKGGTSLTTKEVENEDSKKQRAEQIPEGYIAFGTIHHHCSISAFQSSTDTDDEKNVDGLHITIGNIDKEQFTMHARLYLKGNKFEPDMSAFWDIGKEFIDKILFVTDLGFNITELVDRTARKQMCVRVPDETKFNKMWFDNYLIEKPVVASTPSYYGNRYDWQERHGLVNPTNHGSQGVNGNNGTNGSKRETKAERKARRRAEKEKNERPSIEDVFSDIGTMAELNYTNFEELQRIIDFLSNDREFKMIQEIADICAESKYTFEDLYQEMTVRIREAEEEAIKADNGIPPTQDEIAKQVAEGGSHFGYGID